MSNVFVIIKMCYMHNEWYNISCATQYICMQLKTSFPSTSSSFLIFLLHPLLSPLLPFTKAVYCFTLSKGSKQFVRTCLLRPHPHDLHPTGATWTQSVPSAVLLIPVSGSYSTFCISSYLWCSKCLNISIYCP